MCRKVVIGLLRVTYNFEPHDANSDQYPELDSIMGIVRAERSRHQN